MLAFIAMLFDDLRPLVESQPPFEWNRLGQHLPYEWVEHAVWASGSASTADALARNCAGVVPAPVDQRGG